MEILLKWYYFEFSDDTIDVLVVLKNSGRYMFVYDYEDEFSATWYNEKDVKDDMNEDDEIGEPTNRSEFYRATIVDILEGNITI